MSSKKWFRRTLGVALACASVVSVAAVGGPSGGVVSATTSIDAGGEFHPLTPTRILDTRPGAYSINDIAPQGPKSAGFGPGTNIADGEFNFNPLGLGDLPENATDILAIVATISVVGPTRSGYLAVYPKGFEFGGPDGKGEVSALITYAPDQVVPNLAIVGIGEDDSITFNLYMDGAGTANVLVDVVGFISTSQYGTAGSRLEIVNPGRILDTRTSPNPRNGSFGADDSMELQIRGVDAVAPKVTDIVPNDASITAVMVNLALVNNKPGSKDTFLSATPTALGPNDKATASSFAHAGDIKANMAIVPIGPDGRVHFYNHEGDVDLVVDVLGYFKSGGDVSTNSGRVVPLEAPFRAFDTRLGEFGDAPLQHGSTEQWSFENFAESVTLNPGAANEQSNPKQQGFIGDLFAVGLQKLYPEDSDQSGSFLQLVPGGLPSNPLSANINFGVGEVVPNMSLVKFGESERQDGTGTDKYVVEAFNAYGSVDYVLDVYAIVLGRLSTVLETEHRAGG
ncbi:hypothetical protein [uncultured Ilumatobacter sp.]|uniref:hypothetical protein n=1 Tax=uncultured Ilumatobacter sp. TaxID=879968 RepID=UPI00374EC700